MTGAGVTDARTLRRPLPPVVTKHETGAISVQDREAYWQDVVCQMHLQAGFKSLSAAPYDGKINAYDANGFRASVFTTGAADIRRTRQHINAADTADYLFLAPLSGMFQLEHFGKEALYQPGQAVLVDGAEPFRFVQHDTINCVSLKMPRQYLHERLSIPRLLCALSIDLKSGLMRTATQALLSFNQQLDQIAANTAPSALKTVADLLTLALHSCNDQEPSPLSDARRQTLERALDFIQKEIFSPNLDAARVAAHCGISLSYLHELFRSMETTVGRYISGYRLSCVKTKLADPCHQMRSISQIAFDCGFSNMSHFSRVFREQFGMSPRQYRMQRTVL